MKSNANHQFDKFCIGINFPHKNYDLENNISAPKIKFQEDVVDFWPQNLIFDTEDVRNLLDYHC